VGAENQLLLLLPPQLLLLLLPLLLVLFLVLLRSGILKLCRCGSRPKGGWRSPLKVVLTPYYTLEE
jgi:hypothetical protein